MEICNRCHATVFVISDDYDAIIDDEASVGLALLAAKMRRALCTSPPPTPLLPAPILSAGEYMVSGVDELSLASQNHALVAQKWPPSIFGGLLKTHVVVTMMEPPVSYLESTVHLVQHQDKPLHYIP